MLRDRQLRALLLLGLEKVEHLDGDRRYDAARSHDRLVRDFLGRFEGREIEKGSDFLLLFERPSDAISFCLGYHEALKELSRELALPLAGRAALHLGEVSSWENSVEHIALGARPVEVDGEGRVTVRRVFSLARGHQTLSTRAAHDVARRAAVGDDELPDGVRWLEHGRYRFPGSEVGIDLFEVGIEGTSPLAAPGRRQLVRERSEVLVEERGGWHPAAGQAVPGRPQWILESRLEGGNFGEVWLAGHQRTRDLHAFRFCLDGEDLPRLQRQLALLRKLREALGEPDFIVRPIDSRLDELPFFLESEHVGGELMTHWVAKDEARNLPLADRLALVAGLADAVAAVHDAGAVLGDLQPSNLIVVEEADQPPRLLLAELSSCGLLAPELAEGIPGADAGISPPPPYRAPELTSDDPATPAGDVYALGVLLYQAAAGDLDRQPGPFWERDVEDPLLREDIAAALEPDPGKRLANPGDLAKRLRLLPDRRRLAAEEVERREGDKIRRREQDSSRLRRLQLALAAVSILAGGALMLLAMQFAG